MTAYRNTDTGCLIEVDDDLIGFMGAGWVKATFGGSKPDPAPSAEPADNDDAGAAEPTGADGPPPKSGKGSSDANWTAYARSQGVDVTDDMARKDVIAACEAAGVPVS